MSQTDNDLSLEALVGRGRLVRYAECAALARDLRDGRLRPSTSHPATAAHVACYATEYAKRRGWEPAEDLEALARTAPSELTASWSPSTVGTASIDRRLWTCPQRLHVEQLLREAGHVWPADPDGGAMSGAECIARITAHLDARRGDPSALADSAVLEQRAGWSGRPGLLVEVLIRAGWIHVERDGSRRWESFGVAFAGDRA
ncbi:MAG: hypothetical protein JNM10_13655 [Planctomycetia bacterium]|nr:hypothetical protein [Planctomycetia bacterium]